MKEAKLITDRPLKDRLDDLFNDPEKTLDTICSAVSGGGSATDLCRGWRIPYGVVMNWVREDKDRSRRYDSAVSDRGDWVIESLLKELQSIALFDIRDIYEADGKLKLPKDWPSAVSQAVMSVGAKGEVKFHSKIKAIELLGKNLDIFKDKIEHTGQVTLEDIVGGAYVTKDSG